MGDWGTVAYGIGYMVIGALLLSFLLMPAFVFAAPALALLERGRPVTGVIVGLPGMLWTYAVLGAACIFVFAFIVGRGESGPIWPYLLWGYGVTLAPWAFLARKDAEAGNDNANVMLMFAGMGTLSMMVGTVLNQGPLDIWNLAIWFAPFLVLGVLLQLVVLFEAASNERRLGGQFYR